jgi:hypothetical protein
MKIKACLGGCALDIPKDCNHGCEHLVWIEDPRTTHSDPSISGKHLIMEGLETLEMIYNLHDGLADHNETMFKAMVKIRNGVNG